MALYAAPAYLSRRGLPGRAQELAGHDWLLLRDSGDSAQPLSLRQGTETTLLSVTPRATSNNQLSLQQLCEAGLGLALLSPTDVLESASSGRLLRLLPELQLPPLPLAALTPQRDAQPAKVRHAIDAIRHYLDSLQNTA
jgi:DNA-binding transcriptional LysR family regulator